MDDVHPSAVGVYFAALVHYAVLYEQPVQGLPDLAGLGAEISSWMQQLVDEQVSR
ncbi:hypothetical protein GYB62_03495 [bacterium]|nr:hypothetical protein [bacterium]